MDAGIRIGNDLNTDNLNALSDAIVRVATCSPFESVAREAVEAFRNATRVGPVTLTGCNVYGETPKQDDDEAEQPVTKWGDPENYE